MGKNRGSNKIHQKGNNITSKTHHLKSNKHIFSCFLNNSNTHTYYIINDAMTDGFEGKTGKNRVRSDFNNVFDEVIVSFQIQFFADPVSVDFNTSWRNIHKGCDFFTRHVHPQVSTQFQFPG